MTPEEHLLGAFLKDAVKMPWRKLLAAGIDPAGLAGACRIVKNAGKLGPGDTAPLAKALREAGCDGDFASAVAGELGEEVLRRFLGASIGVSWLAGVERLCDERPEAAADSGAEGVSAMGSQTMDGWAKDAAGCARLLLERGFADDSDAESAVQSATYLGSKNLASAIEAVRQSFSLEKATGAAKAPSRKKRLGPDREVGPQQSPTK